MEYGVGFSFTHIIRARSVAAEGYINTTDDSQKKSGPGSNFRGFGVDATVF